MKNLEQKTAFQQCPASRQAQEAVGREMAEITATKEAPKTKYIVVVYDKNGTTATYAQVNDGKAVLSQLEAECEYGSPFTPRDNPGLLGSGLPVLASALASLGFKCREKWKVVGFPNLSDGIGCFGEIDALPLIYIDKEVCFTFEESGRLYAWLRLDCYDTVVFREKNGSSVVSCPSANFARADSPKYIGFLNFASQVAAALDTVNLPVQAHRISVKMTPSEGLVLSGHANSTVTVSAILKLIEVLAGLAGMSREDLISTAAPSRCLAEVMEEAKLVTAD